jgi:hypothetical protein
MNLPIFSLILFYVHKYSYVFIYIHIQEFDEVAYQLSAQAERAVLEAAIEDAVMFIVLSYNQGINIRIYLYVHKSSFSLHVPVFDIFLIL